MSRRQTPQQQSSSNYLWGTRAIADYIGKSKREAQYLIQKKRIKVKRPGPKTLVTTKQQIDADLKSETT